MLLENDVQPGLGQGSGADRDKARAFVSAFAPRAFRRPVTDVEIDRLLAKAGSGKSKILQATIWVNDIRHRAAMNEVWTKWVDPKNLPGRACIEAKLADPNALVEIMVTAAK